MASVLHVSVLREWYDTSNGSPIFQAGLDAVAEVYLSLVHREEKTTTTRAANEDDETEDNESDDSNVSQIRLDGMFSGDDSDEHHPSNTARIVILKKDLENEM